MVVLTSTSASARWWVGEPELGAVPRRPPGPTRRGGGQVQDPVRPQPTQQLHRKVGQQEPNRSLPVRRPRCRQRAPLGTVEAVALDHATKRVYRRADSATLLALLPELRRLSKRTQKEMEHVERSLRMEPSADIAELRDQTLTALDPDGESLGSTQQSHREFSGMLPLSRDGASENSTQETFAAQLFAYSTAVGERERWIRDELKRRGLIPLWPGEDDYLDQDA